MQTDIPYCKMFAETRGEVLSEAIWSGFGTIALHEILVQEAELDNISKLYNDIVYYSLSSYCIAPLPGNVIFRKKTTQQIRSKVYYMTSTILI